MAPINEAPPPLSGSGGGVIAFTSERDGNFEIYVMNADGSNQRRLTNNQVLDGIPAWRPVVTTVSSAEAATLDDTWILCWPESTSALN
jgi:hypothetical protein